MSLRLVSLTGHEMPLSKGMLCVGTDQAADVPVTPGTGLQAMHFIIDTTGEVATLEACVRCEDLLLASSDSYDQSKPLDPCRLPIA